MTRDDSRAADELAPPAVPLVAPAAETADDEASAIARLLSEFADGGASLKVEWLNDDPRAARNDYRFIGSVDFTREFQEDVAARWGGGRYRGRVYAGGRYRGRVSFGIAGRHRSDDDAPERTALARVETPALDVGQLVAQLGNTFASAVRELADVVRQNAAPARSPAAELVELAKLSRELAPPAPAPRDELRTLEIVERVLDFRDRLVENANPPQRSAASDIIDKGITPLVALFSRAVAVQEKAVGARPAAASSGASTPAVSPAAVDAAAAPVESVSSPAPAAPAATPEAIAAALSPFQRHFLAGAARRSADPSTYAALILDNMPDDESRAGLAAQLGDKQFAARLAAAVPEWSAYPGWFAELADELRAELAPDDDDDDARDELAPDDDDDDAGDELAAAEGGKR